MKGLPTVKLSRESSKSLGRWIRAHHPNSADVVEVGADAEELASLLGFGVGPDDECIEWGMTRTNRSYGNVAMKVENGWKFGSVHKLVRECVDGRVNDLDTLHTCSNKACFSPGHSYVGDDKQNAADRMANNETTCFGETHPEAKLTRSDVAEAREWYFTSGITYRELAVHYGVSKSTMHKAVKGLTWAS